MASVAKNPDNTVASINVANPNDGWANGGVACALGDVSGSTATYNFTGAPFDLPDAASITGIQVDIKWGLTDADDSLTVEVLDVNAAWQSKAIGNRQAANCAATASDQVGADGDLWGGAFTRAHIESASFQVRWTNVATAKAADTYVDSVLITVYYTLESEDLFAKFEISAALTDGSEDLFAKFEVRQTGTEDLFAKFTIRRDGTEDLFAKFVVALSDFEELYAKFEVRQEATEDLFAKFRLLEVGTADLFSKFTVRKTGTEDLFAKILVTRPGSEDLFADFLLLYSDAGELYAKFTVRNVGTQDLFSDIRWILDDWEIDVSTDGNDAVRTSGQQRKIFKNPRGQGNWYCLVKYDADEWKIQTSSDGRRWRWTGVTIPARDYPSLWTWEDSGNNRLIVWIAKKWGPGVDRDQDIRVDCYSIPDASILPTPLFTESVVQSKSTNIYYPCITRANDGYLWVTYTYGWNDGNEHNDTRCKCSTSTNPVVAPGWSTELTVESGLVIDDPPTVSKSIVIPVYATADVAFIYTIDFEGINTVLEGRTGTYAGAGAPVRSIPTLFDSSIHTNQNFSAVAAGPDSDIAIVYRDSGGFIWRGHKYDISANTDSAWEVLNDTNDPSTVTLAVVRNGNSDADQIVAILTTDNTFKEIHAYFRRFNGQAAWSRRKELYQFQTIARLGAVNINYEAESGRLGIASGQSGAGENRVFFWYLNLTSEELFTKFTVRQEATEDLFAKFTVRKTATEDLFAEFVVALSDFEELFADFDVRQEAIEDLFAKFQLLEAGTADLFSKFTIRKTGTEDLFAKILVTRPDSEDLFAKFTVRQGGAAELYAKLNVRQTGTEDLFAKFLIGAEDDVDLFAKFEVRQEASQDLFADLVVRNEGIQDLFAKFLLGAEGDEDLFAKFEVRKTDIAELFAKFEIRRSADEDLFADFTIRKTGTEDLFAQFVVALADFEELYAKFEVRQEATEDLFAKFLPRYAGTEDLFADFTTRRDGTEDLFSKFEIRQTGSQDLYADFIVRQEAIRDLFAKILIIRTASEDLFAEFVVRQEISQDLFADLIIRNADSQDLFIKFTVRQTDTAELFSELTVRHPASENLFAKFTIINEDYADLKAIAIIGQERFQDLFAKFIVAQLDFRDLYAKFEVFPAADLKAIFVVRRSTFIRRKLFAKFTVRHPALLDIKGIFWVGHPGSRDLFATFEMSTVWAEPLDIPCTFYIRPSQLEGAQLIIRGSRSRGFIRRVIIR